MLSSENAVVEQEEKDLISPWSQGVYSLVGMTMKRAIKWECIKHRMEVQGTMRMQTDLTSIGR